ncbi:hypothetical protein RM530_01480 [Algiphilus sp. W345]|uniref:Uncharacterized protein n=1 Tax=Banduia mediterranea TaxID=3075609 RepID=A0ABU2WDT1_9GAMM|nr:hypothetical protein [Algiphilus sp. W345]MDT0496038.1 hypothetical protein [Algiphilus sp. W345]
MTLFNFRNYIIIAALPAFLAAALVACGSGFEGTYTDEMGISQYEFKKDGTARIGAMGTVVEIEYEIDGDELRLLMPQGMTQILTLADDGALEGPMGMRYRKVKD